MCPPVLSSPARVPAAAEGSIVRVAVDSNCKFEKKDAQNRNPSLRVVLVMDAVRGRHTPSREKIYCIPIAYPLWIEEATISDFDKHFFFRAFHFPFPCCGALFLSSSISAELYKLRISSRL